MKTWSKKLENTQKDWKLIDASGKSLGRLASVVAHLLSGKDKPEYTAHAPRGDRIVIINSDKVVLTGKKWVDKKYYTHSRYVGSMKELSARDLGTNALIKRAVQGMLPKNKHRKKFLNNLKIYKDEKTGEYKNLKVTKI